MANYKYDRYDRCLPDNGDPIDARSSSVIRRRQPAQPDDYNTTEIPNHRTLTPREYQELDRNTEPSRQLRYVHTDTQRQTRERIIKRTSNKSLTFYGALSVGVVIAGSIIWNTGVLPFFYHWHNGDSPDSKARVNINGVVCVVVSMLVDDKVVITIIPNDMPTSDRDVKHQIKTYEIKVYAPDAPHIVTIRQEKDERGHDDLQTYIDGTRGPRIVDTGHGQEIQVS